MTDHHMVLSRREGDNPSLQHTIFDGSRNVKQFLFIFEQVIIRDVPEDQRGVCLIAYLGGRAFDAYYEKFTSDCDLIDDAKDYAKVRAWLLTEFAPQEDHADCIQRAVKSRLNPQDLVGSIQELDRIYEKAGFNDQAKYGLLIQACMNVPDLAQFTILKSPDGYEELKLTIREYVRGRDAFRRSPVFPFHAGNKTSVDTKSIRKTNLSETTDESALHISDLESKIDSLTYQMANMSLLIKKQQIATSGIQDEGFNPSHSCSYCKKHGHTAYRCPTNPHRDTKCSTCGKLGHTPATCRKGRNHGPGWVSAPKSESVSEEILKNHAGSSAEAVTVILEPEQDFTSSEEEQEEPEGLKSDEETESDENDFDESSLNGESEDDGSILSSYAEKLYLSCGMLEADIKDTFESYELPEDFMYQKCTRVKLSLPTDLENSDCFACADETDLSRVQYRA